MAEFSGALLPQHQHRFFLSGGTSLLLHRQQFAVALKQKPNKNNMLPRSQSHRLVLSMQISNNNQPTSSSSPPSTFSSKLTTDLPLYESPVATFDQYLNDRPRVFGAIFPDTKRSRRLNDEEWRIQMLPIDFIFLTAKPVIDMRLICKSAGKDYPPGIPRDVTKVLELEATRWEIRGLDYVLKPSDFVLGVKGALYSEKRVAGSRLKGQLEMSISFVLPTVLTLVPKDVLKSVAESVLHRLLENMKSKVNGSLLSDFMHYRNEQLRLVANKNQH